MATCHTCGNDYDRPLTITYEDSEYVFDSFECAIHELAPRCEHCGVTVVGHGVQAADHIFCCAHCASHEGETRLRDRTHELAGSNR